MKKVNTYADFDGDFTTGYDDFYELNRSFLKRGSRSPVFKFLESIFRDSIYKLEKSCYNKCAKQKTNNDLKENALFL